MRRVLSAALAALGLVIGSAAVAAPITINLSGSNASGDPLNYVLPPNPFATGLVVNGTNSSTSNSVAVRRPDGVGVRSCSGLGCLIESNEVDGFNGRDTATFTVSGGAPGFNFILVGATFRNVDHIPNITLLDSLRLSFKDETNATVTNSMDIATVANAQGANTCNLLINDRECSVNFITALGGGDPFYMLGNEFSFTAPGAGDGWYIYDVTWELALLANGVPEPASLALLGLGLAGLGFARRRRVVT